MSDDERRPAREPVRHGASGGELLSDYLDWLRGEVVDAVLDMHAGDRRRSRLPSGWTPIELLSHLMHMERRWFLWGFLGEQVPDPWGDFTVDEPWAADDSDELRPGARWVVPDGVTAERLAERLEAVAERTRDLLRHRPLDTPAALGGRFHDHQPTLEWIAYHVLAEYARHAGHLDVAVEIAHDAGAPRGTD
ncbi:DUF664 domain-containing protein [Nocardioides solisilvae]|uniref:mycothiol transferase n=1 Tax=Nocardioides solisilvae TaxID=1542435 RepID=UPI000D744EBF|nr:DUF664 domain-containing protein [Nocardioides solisilvae]